MSLIALQMIKRGKNKKKRKTTGFSGTRTQSLASRHPYYTSPEPEATLSMSSSPPWPEMLQIITILSLLV